jgi:hypothetical protein
VIDDQIDGHQRIDLLRVGAELGRGVAHGGKVNHGRNAGEILHQHAGRAVGNLVFGGAGLEPFGDGENILAMHGAIVLEPQEVLQHHFH